MSSPTRTEIRRFVLDRFPQASLRDDQDIFSLGFVNSLFAMELVLFLERHGGVEIPNKELDLDNFRTVEAMSALVGRLQPALHGSDVRTREAAT